MINDNENEAKNKKQISKKRHILTLGLGMETDILNIYI